MKTIVIKQGASGNLTLGHPHMPPGWLDGKKRVAYFHIQNVPDGKGAADVLIKLNATALLFPREPEDFLLQWEDSDDGRILRTRRNELLRDEIQESVIARAEKLKLSAYAIAQKTDGAVSEDHVKNFLERRSSMGSHKLQHILRVLGLKVTE